jgi:hypothetical protein
MRQANSEFGVIQVRLGVEGKHRLSLMAARQQRDLSKMVRWLIDQEWNAGQYTEVPCVEPEKKMAVEVNGERS